MILSELLTTVKGILRRPDMDAVINTHVLAAVRAIHATIDFANDYEEWLVTGSSITYTAGTNSLVGSFDYPNDIRVPESVLALDAAGNRIAELELISSKEILKRKRANVSTQNTAYRSGANKISFYCTAIPLSFTINGYTFRPEFEVTNNSDGTTRDVTDTVIANYRTWLLDMYPVVVQDYVIGQVAARIGEKDISNSHLGSYVSIHEPILLNLGK